MPKYRERPQLGYYWINADDKDIGFLDGKLGKMFPRVIDGYAKYEEQERRRRRSPMRWAGSGALRVSFDILFTGATSESRVEDSVETDIRKLEKMAGLVRDGYEPPHLEWAANGPHDYNSAPQLDWLLEELTWSEEQGDYNWNDLGNRTKAHCSITLATFTEVQYVKADVPNLVKAKQKKKKDKAKSGSKNAKVSTYTVTSDNETLSKIAANQLGSSSRYPEIAKLNDIRDPSDIKQGTVLKMP